MASWSLEAIIALITLFATCAPLAALLWGLTIRKRRNQASRGRLSMSHPITSFLGPPNRRSSIHWVYLVRRESEFHVAFVADENGRLADHLNNA
ncbi:hypothetical protein K505DRAFT_356804 [Melanomma pulvis-pyrius CBS 109.77]|uniref:Uncharacterized protein n=1 Tax=Melanomma pulvis-pyrius CBS 109.77 TaxID=1314802 RepID=A0A6A6XT63_9PLEO|nr:hypothetical protein K505DRAFT_356804 [Melanomma pulvis-pyrius CBS 109.77]